MQILRPTRQGVGLAHDDATEGTYELIEGARPASTLIHKTNTANVDIVPAQLDLVAVELEIIDQPKREFFLANALRRGKREIRLHNH